VTALLKHDPEVNAVDGVRFSSCCRARRVFAEGSLMQSGWRYCSE
jgi:hypothetical protein